MIARIYRPAKSATQSGKARAKYWLLVFDQNAPREIDPLMGWTSSGDMKSQVRLLFTTKEEAITYAEKMNINYQIEEPKQNNRTIISYSDNFKSTRLGQWTH